DITETSSQQTYHRAKKHVADGKARTEIDEAAARRIVEEFLAAATSGRTEPLIRLLTADAVSVGDGGGKVPARAKAFEGALAVATFMRGLFKPSTAKRNILGGTAEIYAAVANGGPAIVAVVDGRVVGVTCLEVGPEGIVALRRGARQRVPGAVDVAVRRRAREVPGGADRAARTPGQDRGRCGGPGRGRGAARAGLDGLSGPGRPGRSEGLGSAVRVV
ncbi:hypothetical protein ACWCQ0_53385, partial [Streptomyces massasporeus]